MTNNLTNVKVKVEHEKELLIDPTISEVDFVINKFRN